MPNKFGKECEYASIDIFLGFGGSVLICLWKFDQFGFEKFKVQYFNRTRAVVVATLGI
jgi:hypothetical protein